MAEGRLYKLSLLFPEKAVAGEQSFACETTKRPLEQAWLMEFWGLVDENLSNQVRVIELINAQRTQAEISDIAKLARDAKVESQRIKGIAGRKHLADHNHRKTEVWTVWIFSLHRFAARARGLGGCS